MLNNFCKHNSLDKAAVLFSHFCDSEIMTSTAWSETKIKKGNYKNILYLFRLYTNTKLRST